MSIVGFKGMKRFLPVIWSSSSNITFPVVEKFDVDYHKPLLMGTTVCLVKTMPVDYAFNLVSDVAWTGLYDFTGDGQNWRWVVDHSPLNYTNWAGSSPRGAGRCVSMTVMFQWTDAACSQEKQCICESDVSLLFQLCASICKPIRLWFLSEIFELRYILTRQGFFFPEFIV